MRVSWYFDFISPFAYLQSERLHAFPDDVDVLCTPVLFAGLRNHWGHKGPAEIPAKRRFTYRHALWLARRDGVALQAPPAHPFNPLNALRLAIALDNDPEAIQAIFRYIWAEGRDTAGDPGFATLAARLGVADAGDRIAQDDVRRALRTNTDRAIEQGVFGVPTIVTGNELFWGYDATDMALAYLADPADFDDDAMQRADAIPIGVERPR